MTSKKLSLYLDTSVIGGYFDEEFMQDTRALFKNAKAGKYDIFISSLTQSELENAPSEVKNLLSDLPVEFKVINVLPEYVELADEYVRENVVGATSKDDCVHIATATINNIDILVSWNFKHIVNVQRIRGYNSINIRNGYKDLEIRSPRELAFYE